MIERVMLVMEHAVIMVMEMVIVMVMVMVLVIVIVHQQNIYCLWELLGVFWSCQTRIPG